MRKFLLALIGGSCLLSGCSLYSASANSPSLVAVDAGVSATVAVSLSSAQERLVRAHIASENAGSRGRNGRLPPGIARNLERGKSLPPGIAKQYLPADVTEQLPALPGGYQYLVIAGKLLLVEAATQVIREVLLEAVA